MPAARSSTSAGSKRELIPLNAHGMNRGVRTEVLEALEALDPFELLLLEDLSNDPLLPSLLLSLLGGRGIGRFVVLLFGCGCCGCFRRT